MKASHNYPSLYFALDLAMSRISHKWILKIGVTGTSKDNSKPEDRIINFNKSAASTKTWMPFIYYNFVGVSESLVLKIESDVHEHAKFKEFRIDKTELFIMRHSLKGLASLVEDTVLAICAEKGIKYPKPARAYKEAGARTKTLHRISIETEKRIKIKKEIDKLIKSHITEFDSLKLSKKQDLRKKSMEKIKKQFDLFSQ